jgi:hypothetical protein
MNIENRHGAGSLVRTRLWITIPDLLGKYRDFVGSQTSRWGHSSQCGLFSGSYRDVP